MTDSVKNWTRVTVGGVVEFYDYRRVPLSSRERSQRHGKYPYYGASGIIDYIDDYIFDGRYLLIAEDGENLNSRKTPIAFFASGKFWVNNHAHIVRCNQGKADDYFLKSWFDQANISGYITGAAQPKLSQANLKRIQLPLPPLSTQRKIAAILSAYDDLIENNSRRIKILEEMASAIYREWFINFRFPGYEKVKTVDSHLGPIPDGWKLRKVGDIIELAYGKALKASDREDGTFPVFGSSGVVGHHSKSLVEGPGIIVGRKGNVGTVFWSDESFYPIDTVYFVRTAVSLYYAFFNLQQQNFLSGDAAVPGLNRNYAYSLPFLLPSPSVLGTFDEFCVPVFEELRNLRTRNENLRHTRDLLLTKLISGELDVEKLDIPIPEAEQTAETTPVASTTP
jgi:type I restriction enzyme, S subunit